MKKLALVLVPILAFVTVPFALMLMVTAVSVPTAAQELRAARELRAAAEQGRGSVRFGPLGAYRDFIAARDVGRQDRLLPHVAFLNPVGLAAGAAERLMCLSSTEWITL